MAHKGLQRVPGIEYTDTRRRKIFDIPCHHRHPVDEGSGSNQPILNRMWIGNLKPSSTEGDGSIYGQNPSRECR